MSSRVIGLKWSKKEYNEVPFPATAAELRDAIRQLTGVLPERQTLFCKALWKGTLGKEVDLTGMDPKDAKTGKPHQIVLMGTASETMETKMEVAAPVVFAEDLNDGETVAQGLVLPPGLVNMGNTCYLNATLQMLKSSDELTHVAPPSLAQLQQQGGLGAAADALVTRELAGVFAQLGRSQRPVLPDRFVTVVRRFFTGFDAKSPRGEPMQQDAEEFYTLLLNFVVNAQRLSPGNSSSLVEDYFGIQMSVSTKCIESEAEPPRSAIEHAFRLPCIITKDVSHLDAGIKLGLTTEVEMQSNALGRGAVWSQTRKVARAPKYLVVQLSRFFWKETPDSQDHRGVACKALRAVKFSKTMDAYEYFDEDLKEYLRPKRETKYVALESAPKKGDDSESKSNNAMEIDDDEEELRKALAMSMEEESPVAPTSNVDRSRVVGPGVPQGFTGKYELTGVVSHKGRASNSGHYMAWVRNPTDPKRWTVFDDDHSSDCKWEDVEALAGGGDHHMAYLLMYRATDE